MLDFFRVTPKKRKVKIRKRNGIIFSNPSPQKKIIFYTGSVVFLYAIGYLIFLYWPLMEALFNYNLKPRTIDVGQVSQIEDEMAAKYPDEFSINIPKITAVSKIEKNVSPYNQKEYLKVLSNDIIAQAKGTDLPGQGLGKATYLFAHSTRQGINMVRKNSVFYLLDKLTEGDIIFIRYNGKIYRYKTYMKKVVNASEVNYINYKDESKEIIILQTCWPIGTDWKRLLVFAERI